MVPAPIALTPSTSHDSEVGGSSAEMMIFEFPSQLKVFVIDDSEMMCKGYSRLLLPQLKADLSQSEVCCPKTKEDVRNFIENVMSGTPSNPCSISHETISSFDRDGSGGEVCMFGLDGIDMIDEATFMSQGGAVVGGGCALYSTDSDDSFFYNKDGGFDIFLSSTKGSMINQDSSADICILDQNIDVVSSDRQVR
jgi:hypothetical protein